MRPDIKDTVIRIPTAFEVQGGRKGWARGRVIGGLLLVAITVLMALWVYGLDDWELWLRVPLMIVIGFVGFVMFRFIILREGRLSDILESQLEADYEVRNGSVWRIYEISSTYPYVCHFLNGYKGIFVRMVRGAVVGRAEDSPFYHFECLGDAYLKAHSLNMDMIHIDYMGDMGNDTRLDYLISEAKDFENPELRMMFLDVYQNLRDSVKNSYAIDDVYLFLSRDNLGNFFDSVRVVAEAMLGENFLSYKVLSRANVGLLAMELFNCHEFDVYEACESVLNVTEYSGISLITLERSGVVVRDFKTGEVKGYSHVTSEDTMLDIL